MEDFYDTAVVGGGIGGLSTAFELANAGLRVVVIESMTEIGGLASAFIPDAKGSERLDCYYHHVFNHDTDFMTYLSKLGLEGSLIKKTTSTASYVNGKVYRLSTPIDLLCFSPLSFIERVKVGLHTLKVRKIKDWHELENITTFDWLKRDLGDKLFRKMWEPLLRAKFGSYAEEISAVWFWSKLVLRGGSRGSSGAEELCYVKGGFIKIIEALAQSIKNNGGDIKTSTDVDLITKNEDDCIFKLSLNDGSKIHANSVVLACSLPEASCLINQVANSEYIKKLNDIPYLGNVCLTLELKNKLSDTYWLNVGESDFPFVGIIEHTNLEVPESYGGRHIVYLSKYLKTSEPQYLMDNKELLCYAIPYIKRIYPNFNKDLILAYHVYRSKYAQPVVGINYSARMPEIKTPYKGLYINSTAQIYPEDRGLNYGIRNGIKTARLVISDLKSF